MKTALGKADSVGDVLIHFYKRVYNNIYLEWLFYVISQ
jgi:hypothetical protein